MSKFTWGDSVQIAEGAPADLRPGSMAVVVGLSEERHGSFLERFPHGMVYTVEYEDGSSVELHEDHLVALP